MAPGRQSSLPRCGRDVGSLSRAFTFTHVSPGANQAKHCPLGDLNQQCLSLSLYFLLRAYVLFMCLYWNMGVKKGYVYVSNMPCVPSTCQCDRGLRSPRPFALPGHPGHRGAQQRAGEERRGHPRVEEQLRSRCVLCESHR